MEGLIEWTDFFSHEMQAAEKRTTFFWIHFLELVTAKSEEDPSYSIEEIASFCQNYINITSNPSAIAESRQYFHDGMMAAIKNTFHRHLREWVQRHHEAQAHEPGSSSVEDKMEDEMKALMPLVPRYYIRRYIVLCLSVTKNGDNQIEKLFKKDLNILLLEEMKGLTKNESKCLEYNALVEEEWSMLTKNLLAEEVVFYAFNFLRENFESFFETSV